MKVAVIVGHRQSRQGAKSVPVGYPPFRYTEYTVNKEIARHCARQLCLSGIIAERIYGDLSISEKIAQVKEGGYDFVVELHCNSAASKTAEGTETLYRKGSEKGRRLAAYVNDAVVQLLRLRNRGILDRGPGERGGRLLHGLPLAVIVEPLFLSNSTEAPILRYPVMQEALGRSIADGIQQYVEWDAEQ